jgi:uncharacterized protein (TIGR04562 family)
MDKLQLADMWKFPWPVMDVLIGGNSSIDLPELKVNTWEEATDFLRCYGYDPEVADDARTLHCVVVEALAFIERKLVTPREWTRGIRPPDDILLCDDVRHLLMWAGSVTPTDRLKRAWACAVLRVMHTIAHIEGVNRYVSASAARQQIMARFQRFIWRDEQRAMWFGDADHKIRLERVEWKEQKTRNSIILKLLHKKDNVAETIFDYLGIRIVTKRLCDVMMAVKFLRMFHIVSYPNAIPARARNNLIDVQRFRSQVETLRDMLTAGSIAPDEFETMVARLSAEQLDPSAAQNNPHSSASYRSIQLTGRQLVSIPNEHLTWLDKLNREIVTHELPPVTQTVLREMNNLVSGWHSVHENRQVSAFFPYEVQIMDHESYQQATSGEANHGRYKQSQVRAARKRVLHKVLELSKDKL